MSDWSDDALSAARRAWHELPPTVPMTVIIMRMVDAIAPIVRADERRIAREALEDMDRELGHLRAAVAALINDPEVSDGQETAAYILALLNMLPKVSLGGESDG